jgi:hypothetical protein
VGRSAGRFQGRQVGKKLVSMRVAGLSEEKCPNCKPLAERAGYKNLASMRVPVAFRKIYPAHYPTQWGYPNVPQIRAD